MRIVKFVALLVCSTAIRPATTQRPVVAESQQFDAPKCRISAGVRLVAVRRDELTANGTWVAINANERPYTGFPAINSVSLTCDRHQCRELIAQLISERDSGSSAFCGRLSVTEVDYTIRRWDANRIEAVAKDRSGSGQIHVNIKTREVGRSARIRNENRTWQLR